jgi:hypothetical protein
MRIICKQIWHPTPELEGTRSDQRVRSAESRFQTVRDPQRTPPHSSTFIHLKVKCYVYPGEGNVDMGVTI